MVRGLERIIVLKGGGWGNLGKRYVGGYFRRGKEREGFYILYEYLFKAFIIEKVFSDKVDK